MANLLQCSTQPPAQPAYILRGHTAQIHAVHFYRQNLRLLTGDADGWVVVWSLTTKRGVAVWRAHTKTILGLGSWHNDKIITHGRDNKLYVWHLQEEDESTFSTILPITSTDADRKQPWLLHSLDISTINFCSFASCYDQPDSKSSDAAREDILVATPGIQDGHINITALPTLTRVATVPTPKGTKPGMLMAVNLYFMPLVKRAQTEEGSISQADKAAAIETRLMILAGYESGHVCIWREVSRHGLTQDQVADGNGDTSRSRVIKFDMAYLAQPHTQPVLSLGIAPLHDCFFTSSADAIIARHALTLDDYAVGDAGQTVQTKHAGQQSLQVRNQDNRIFATAGWDGRMRVYSTRTMRELAVLKWHCEGCYALAFAEVVEPSSDEATTLLKYDRATDHATQDVPLPQNMTVAEQRIAKAKNAHWLAAGSKDGKVSLWEVY